MCWLMTDCLLSSWRRGTSCLSCEMNTILSVRISFHSWDTQKVSLRYGFEYALWDDAKEKEKWLVGTEKKVIGLTLNLKALKHSGHLNFRRTWLSSWLSIWRCRRYTLAKLLLHSWQDWSKDADAYMQSRDRSKAKVKGNQQYDT